MSKIRVLIVDDSVVIRKILSDVLGGDPAIDIAGVAANGRIALAKIPQVNPDLITLDIEMPEMDGLQTLREIRKDYPDLPVVMFSTLTERGAEATLDALAMGASDYVTKPANVGKVSLAMDRLRSELIPRIKALVPQAFVESAPRPVGLASDVGERLRLSPRAGSRPPIDVVAIGVSTGGPNALAELMPVFRSDFPVPIVIVQHMPPVFTRNLADRLNKTSAVEVSEASDGVSIRAGAAYIAQGGQHMTVSRRGTDVVLKLNEDPPENSCRPAVDVLFRSVVEVYGDRVLGVVMTGMGYDGCLGSERIREAGGRVLVQDEATSVVWGMPGIVATSGLADQVLPLGKLGASIVQRVMTTRRRAVTASVEDTTS